MLPTFLFMPPHLTVSILYIFGTQFPFEPPARRQQVEGGSAGGDDAKAGSVEGTVEDEEPIVPVPPTHYVPGERDPPLTRTNHLRPRLLPPPSTSPIRIKSHSTPAHVHVSSIAAAVRGGEESASALHPPARRRTNHKCAHAWACAIVHERPPFAPPARRDRRVAKRGGGSLAPAPFDPCTPRVARALSKPPAVLHSDALRGANAQRSPPGIFAASGLDAGQPLGRQGRTPSTG